MDLAGLAVEEFWGANDFSAEGCANGLMAETNPENRKFSGQAFDQLHRDTRALGRTRTARNHNTLGLSAVDFFDGGFVVAMDIHTSTKFAEILREVGGKRVLVVQEQNYRYFPAPISLA